jgi:hypothetical protein
MTTTTPVRSISPYPEEFLVRSYQSGASLPSASETPSSTRGTRSTQSIFAGVFAPFFAIAAFAAPGYSPGIRRVFSGASRSESEIIHIHWDEDAWLFTTEPAAVEEIEALNRLLAMPASEGFSLDLRGDD